MKWANPLCWHACANLFVVNLPMCWCVNMFMAVFIYFVDVLKCWYVNVVMCSCVDLCVVLMIVVSMC